MAEEEQRRPTRPTAELIYERVKEDARDELERQPSALAFSGVLAGFTIGATPLALALGLTLLDGADARFVATLVYPIGFVAVILGRSQLFTENTLYPVVASLEEPRLWLRTARLWGIVLGANVAGCILFGLLAVGTSALSGEVVDEMTGLGEKAAEGVFGKVFWGAVVAGWLLALVAWLVEASETAIGQLVVIWSLTLLVGLGDFSHSVATTVEVAAATLDGVVGVGEGLGWLGVTVLGNVVGGVAIVTLMNYGQVRAPRER